MPNILINPNSGVMEFTTGTAGGSTFDAGITGGNRAARLSYDNLGGLNLTSYVNITGSGFISGQDRFTIDGVNGRLFSVTDNLSGSLFSVNDIAGLPIIEAFDDNTVIMGAFNRNDFVLTGNSLGLGAIPNTGTTKLLVSGNVSISGNLNLNGNQLVDYVPQFINETTNFIISGNDNGRVILARAATEITGTIASGNVTGFNTTIIQVGNGQVRVTGSGIGIGINEFGDQYRTAGIYGTISLLHTGNNRYIMYGNTAP